MAKKLSIKMRAKVDDVLKQLDACVDSGDTESAHSTADWILCNFLSELGYQEIVDRYDKVDKWYA